MLKHPKDSHQQVEKTKRPYQAPRIISREVLEAMAASCLQPGSKPDPVLCPSGPVQS